MIRSMTGFASIARESAGGRISVTVKSVNHRFLDIALKAPHALGALESRIRTLVQQRVTRGRVELTVGAEVTSAPAREVVLDEALLAQIVEVVGGARERGIITGTLTASDLLRLPQVLEIRTRSGDAPGVSDELSGLVEDTVIEAVDALITMRDMEGRLIGLDIEARLAAIAGFVDRLERDAVDGQRGLEARLRERLAALPADLHLDPAALAQEVVRFVSRSDVDEEVVRLRTHLEHGRALAAGPEACGRKLDFLIQEMNREVNTIGSKVEGARATEVVIAAKAELERVKEQVQNVE